MARVKTTVYLEEEILAAAHVVAAALKKTDSQVLEEALTSYVAKSADESRARLLKVLEDAKARNELSEEEALEALERAQAASEALGQSPPEGEAVRPVPKLQA